MRNIMLINKCDIANQLFIRVLFIVRVLGNKYSDPVRGSISVTRFTVLPERCRFNVKFIVTSIKNYFLCSYARVYSMYYIKHSYCVNNTSNLLHYTLDTNNLL